MKRCNNCDGKGHLVFYEGIRTETRCDVCMGKGVVPVAPSENGIGSTLDDVIMHHEAWATYFAETGTKRDAMNEHHRMAQTLRGVREQRAAPGPQGVVPDAVVSELNAMLDMLDVWSRNEQWRADNESLPAQHRERAAIAAHSHRERATSIREWFTAALPTAATETT